jgi:hypothetical protein
MRKNIYIIGFIFYFHIVNAQTDVINKPNPITHLIGIDLGYSNYGYLKPNNVEANLNYVFNPHFFCVKAQFGFTPVTDYGTLTKIFVSMGFSTKICKVFSWHLLTGFGGVIPSKSYYNNSLSVSNFF